MNKRMKGFTLLELLTVVVVIGIITATAIPAYNNYIARSQQSTAMAKISEIAQAMERYYTNKQKMTNNLVTLGYSKGVNNDYYTFTLATKTANPAYFMITGTVQSGSGVQAKVNYRLDNLGNQERQKVSGKWKVGW